MDQDREKKIREEIRKKLEEEFERKESSQKRTDNFDREELILREKIRKEEEERFYRQKGLVKYKNKYGEIEWLTPEEAQKRYNRRKKKKKSIRRKWKALRGKLLEYVIFTLILFSLYAFYKYFQKKSRPVRTIQTIEIESNIHGAYIFLNGMFQNTYSPSVLRNIPPGTHLIQVWKPGFVTAPPFIQLKVGRNQRHTVYFQLFPVSKLYTLQLPEQLNDSKVYVDGLPVKLNGISIQVIEGLHVLYIENKKFKITPSKIWFYMDRNKSIPVNIEKTELENPAFISISSSIPDIHLFINDKLWGIQPNGQYHPIPPGSYKIDAYYPSYRFSPSEFIFELKPGEKKKLIVSPQTQNNATFTDCQFELPEGYFILIDGIQLKNHGQANLNLIEGDHMLTILSKDLTKEWGQKIYVGGATFIQFEWDPRFRKFVKKAGEQKSGY